MRGLVACVVFGVASAAAAPSKPSPAPARPAPPGKFAPSAKAAVEAIVRTSIVKLAQLADDDELGFTDDAIVLDEQGDRIDLANEENCTSGAVANAFYGCLQASIRHDAGAITTSVDDGKGIAWFQAPFTVTMVGDLVEDDAPERKHAMRVGGIAVRRGGEWKLVAAMYTTPVTDKQLLASSPVKVPTSAPKLAGDRKLAGAVAAWFATGFAPAAVKTGVLLASGTSPREYKAGAGAVALARSWDKLKLVPTAVTAHVLANGAIGYVLVDVVLPRKPGKDGKDGIEMKLAVVAVPDAGTWRWVSLQYQPPFEVGARNR